MPAIQRLRAGFKVFKARYYEHRPELIETLRAFGQQPETLVIACSDSRVDPAILLGSEPGELFVVRNVANLVPPYHPDGRQHGTSAALEFGVRDLAVKNIVIVGHSGCGGIQALRRCCAGDPMKEREFIGPWVASAARACEDVSSDADNALVERNAIAISLENLRTFPWIDEAVTAGQLALHGWWFDFDRGQLWAFDDRTGAFAILE